MSQNTIFARTPEWVLRHKTLTLNAKAVYGALMLRADNETLECWPSRQTIADDLGTSLPTVRRALTKLKEAGAIIVIQRKRKGTKENDSNLYRMVFDPPQAIGGVTGDLPRVTGEPTGGVTGEPVTRPTQLNPVTRPTSLYPQQVEAPLYPQQVEADDSHDSFSDDSFREPRTATSHQPKNRHGLKEETYVAARNLVQAIGEVYRDSQDYETAWALQSQLTEFIEENMRDQSYWIELANIVANESSFTEKHADPYEAGKKLLTLISTSKIPRDELLDRFHYPSAPRPARPSMEVIQSWKATPNVEQEQDSSYRPF